MLNLYLVCACLCSILCRIEGGIMALHHVIAQLVPITCLPIDRFNYRAWHYKNYHVTKTGSHFVGQKGNQINRVSLVIQY